MASVEQFIDYVSAHAPDAPSDLIQFFIQESVTDFLIDTKLATSFFRIKMYDKVNDYVLDIPECHTILDTKRVLVGTPCDQTVDWDELKRTSNPERTGYYLDLNNDGMPAIWIGEPCETQEVEVEYVYTTKRGPCDIPDFVYDRHSRAIQYMALSKIYGVPGQDWSSPQTSLSYLQLYNNEIANIKRTNKRYDSGKFRAKPFIGGRCCGFGGFFR